MKLMMKFSHLLFYCHLIYGFAAETSRAFRRQRMMKAAIARSKYNGNRRASVSGMVRFLLPTDFAKRKLVKTGLRAEAAEHEICLDVGSPWLGSW